MKRQLPTLLFALGLLLLSACSGTDQPAGPTTIDQRPPATTTISGSHLSAQPVPPPELDSGLTGDDLLVAIEARWMCDVQRFAFSDLEAMNGALYERLSLNGLSRADYEAFKAELEGRIDLREQVLVDYDAYCGED